MSAVSKGKSFETFTAKTLQELGYHICFKSIRVRFGAIDFDGVWDIVAMKRNMDNTVSRLYVQYVMLNEQKFDPRKINQEERDILQKWREAGHIEGGASGLAVTKEFWDIINDILFETYVKGRDE